MGTGKKFENGKPVPVTPANMKEVVQQTSHPELQSESDKSDYDENEHAEDSVDVNGLPGDDKLANTNDANEIEEETTT